MKLKKGYVALFQYGSNMLPARLNSSDRLSGRALLPSSARLGGWGVRFNLYSRCNGCGVTNIVSAKREYVLGVVYQVPVRLIYAPEGRRSRMDKIEGARPNGTGNYERRMVKIITMRGEAILAATYIGTKNGRKRFSDRSQKERRVSREYFSYVLKGARRFGLPTDYVSYLRRQAGPLKD